MKQLDSQILTSFEEILTDIGYVLSDGDDCWRTSALYRGGNNPMSLKIYKDSGVWIDYGADNLPRPFAALVEFSCNNLGVENVWKGRIPKPKTTSGSPSRDKIEMDKVYAPSILDRLVKNYDFYVKRGISSDTLEKYECGVAMSGKMHGRFTFPIFDEMERIVGFTGRNLQDDDRPKWKHIGKVQHWVYPVHCPKHYSASSIDSSLSVILVESIGDSLALTENSIFNHLVLFGLNVNEKVIGYLLSHGISNITIATNNDKTSKDNNGLLGAVRIYEKLSRFFDLDCLQIKLPLANDFGDMHEQGISFDDWLSKEIPRSDQIKGILNILKKNKSKVGIKKEYLDTFKHKLRSKLWIESAYQQVE